MICRLIDGYGAGKTKDSDHLYSASQSTEGETTDNPDGDRQLIVPVGERYVGKLLSLMCCYKGQKWNAEQILQLV